MSPPKQTQVRAKKVWLNLTGKYEDTKHVAWQLPATPEAYEAMLEQAWTAQGMLTHAEMAKVLSALGLTPPSPRPSKQRGKNSR